MSIFNFIKRKLAESDNGPDIKFGRHIFNAKEQEEQALFGEAIRLYEDDELLPSIEYLLSFLRIDMEDNLAYDVQGGELFFELYQGSKQILGRCNDNKFVAVADVARISGPNIGLYRKLLERNYLFKYCRFCIDGERLIIKFDSFTMDASPQKLFHALKEMSINADKYDDILADEFDELENHLSGKITYLSPEILTTKEAYLRTEIQKTLDSIGTILGSDESQLAITTYLLLYCNYKLDYLTKPEGYVMEILERNHRAYFDNNKQTASQKCEEIKENFQLVLERSSDQLKDEFYQTCHTFDYTKAASHHDLRALIEKEIPKAQMYYSSGKNEIAQIVCGYIASYSLFHYSLPTPDLDLLDLLLRVLENEYFVSLGFTPSYTDEYLPIQAIVEKKLELILRENKATHPYLKINYSNLVFTDMAGFAISFLEMVASIDIHYHKQFM
jgi:hypothetical protein